MKKENRASKEKKSGQKFAKKYYFRNKKFLDESFRQNL